MSEELKKAKDVVQSFLKSKKILRMYPSNNPIYINTLEDNFNKLREFFHYRDDLTLKIRQNDIHCDSEQVYFSSEKEDNLALFFFKDGLREITFRKGLTFEEMEEFLRIISLDFNREAVDDDIVTLFWEKDFQNIQYVVDETVLADEDDYEETAVARIKESEPGEDTLLKAYEDAFKEDEVVKDASIVPLSDKDLQLLLTELEKDSQDKTDKLTDILFEIFSLPQPKEDYEDMTGFFINAIEFSIGRGDIQLVTDVLARMKKILDEKNEDEERKKYARKILLLTGSESIITLLGEILDSGQDVEERVFEDFVKYLDRNAIVPFMKILGELKSIHARKVVIDALILLGTKDIATLSKGLNDSRWYVVRNIIYILRKIGDRKAVDYLLKSVRHGDIRVKKEVIRALGELGGAGVLQTLRDCLDDTDHQVRSAALKALGNIKSEAAKRIIMNKVADKSFGEREFDEKKEYFEVLSQWKDGEVYSSAVSILKRKTFFGRAKNYENRACAAYCLGLLGNKDALSFLNKYKNDGNKLFREFVYTAIKRIEYGQ
ncbi:MAG: HEAT repeat domain-containing protein [Nitrospiraceae bacterium]|nr:HEAT repeat domain-containing protein [Nitrospiraceae bacterium]